MTWRKKQDWNGYKEFLLLSDIHEECQQRYDYRLRRYVGGADSLQRIKDKITELESGIDRQYGEDGHLIVYKEKDGTVILNKQGNHIPKLGKINDTVKVSRMNGWIKQQMHAPTKKFKKHMFTFLYKKRFKEFKGE
jgi:hypothetical protein